MSDFIIRTDGGSRSNPGPAAIGAVIENGKYVLLGPKVNHTGPSTNSNTKEIDVSE